MNDGKVLGVYADGQLHRRLLDRITGVALTSLHGRLVVRLTLMGNLRDDWIQRHVTFCFVVDCYSRVLMGRGNHCYGSPAEPQYRNVEVNLHDPTTGQSTTLGNWGALDIFLIAGEEVRTFHLEEAAREEDQ